MQLHDAGQQKDPLIRDKQIGLLCTQKSKNKIDYLNGGSKYNSRNKDLATKSLMVNVK